jgi:hypothetical protein
MKQTQHPITKPTRRVDIDLSVGLIRASMGALIWWKRCSAWVNARAGFGNKSVKDMGHAKKG